MAAGTARHARAVIGNGKDLNMLGVYKRQPGAKTLRWLGAAMLGFALGGLGAVAHAQEKAAVAGTYRGLLQVERFSVSPPLRDLPVAPPFELGQKPPIERRSDLPTGNEGALGPQDADPIVQSRRGEGLDIPSPTVSFDAISATGYTPPDTVGDVGPSHYVQMVNTSYAVYNKSGALVAGPYAINTLWSGFGGACQTENSGDPVVLYDQFADRWLLMQFTSAGPTYYLCLALSTSGDPTGTFYRWAVSTGTHFPDYPKLGVWNDAYLASTRDFDPGFVGVGVYALNRTQMLAGNPSPLIVAMNTGTSPAYAMGDGLQPVDIDGFTLPPTGSPAYYIGSQDNGGPYAAPSDALNVWKFAYNFQDPPSSSLLLTDTIAVTAFDSMLAACSGRSCVPQPGTANKVDHQGYRQRVLHRAAYRNFGTYESIVTNQSIEASAISGIRWWELRSPNASPFVYQEGTYAPGATDGIHRWFGSFAQDKYGNAALGYSVSDGTSTYPGIRYTGRLVTDTLGQLPQGEGTIVSGGGSQTGSQRWGDYSSMNVDPVDDCTFWYTTEYYATSSSGGWKTRVGAFKFPGCKAAGGARRVFVASTGNDANASSNCPVTAPCRTFKVAVEVVDAGGEVIALDSAGYGPVNITRSLSLISAPGARASISASSGNAITIGAPNVDVVLRGLSLHGNGATHGIYINNGTSVAIEQCVIYGFSSGNGVFVAGPRRVSVTDTLLRDNAIGAGFQDGAIGIINKSKLLGSTGNGIVALATLTGTTTNVSVSRSVVQGAGGDFAVSSQAFLAGAVARVQLTQSAISSAGVGVAAYGAGLATVSTDRIRISGNLVGLYVSGAGAAIKTRGNNTVSDNGTNLIGSLTALGGL